MIRILYAGSPETSALVLGRLLEAVGAGAPFSVAGVLTNLPSFRGRGKIRLSTPAAVRAEQAGIPVIPCEKLDEGCRAQVAALKPDILVCFAYGKIFGPKFLALFSLGGINLHPSLLPKYRGASPVPAAILAGDKETGVTVQKLTLQMDAGDVLAQEKIPLGGSETAESLLQEAAEKGAGMLVRVLSQADTRRELPPGTPQNHGEATYCAACCREDGLIDWTQSAVRIDAQIRAFYPWPGAFTGFNGELLKIIRARPYSGKVAGKKPGIVAGVDKEAGILIQTGDGVLSVQHLQRAMKKEVPWKDFLNGCPHFIDTVLG
ncbi:MAG: methionyl-tRNA formyltransferase [Spirochaetaceae bacterium]|jgi:methionyl-tRNA formyltransferase|nr:methionyl-tRNA formyltransferase [Spirochaetaceae bacterium]